MPYILITSLGIMPRANEQSTSAILKATRSITLIIAMSPIDAWLLMRPAHALRTSREAARNDHYRNEVLTLPQLFDGIPAKKIEGTASV